VRRTKRAPASGCSTKTLLSGRRPRRRGRWGRWWLVAPSGARWLAVPAGRRSAVVLAHNGTVSRQPFQVALGELSSHRGERRVVRSGRLEAALVADVDSRVPAGAEAVANVVIEIFEGGAAVSGTVRSVWEGECRRCLTALGGDLETPVREVFRRGGGQADGTYPMEEDLLDLEEMVLDCLFAALPVLPLCQPGCLGICPQCGSDRNVSPCTCREPLGDQRWAALDALRNGD